MSFREENIWMNLSATEVKTWFFTFLFSLSAFAHEDCAAPSAFEFPPAIILAMDAVALEWNAVSPTQYENAFCKNQEVPDYDQWLASQAAPVRPRQSIKGFEFQGQSQKLLDAFRDITRNMPARESSCTSVLCAVDEIWGPHIGRRILYVRARHGFNTSELAFRNTRRLTHTELDDILITLSDLPPELEMVGQGGNQRMTLAAEGVTHPTIPEAAADAAINFYDRWRGTSRQQRQYGLFHEFGHNISEIRGNLDRSREWRSLEKRCVVSGYGKTDNREDFAEAVMKYRFNGQGLRESCPEKYAFLKREAFQGREYLDNSQCN